MSTNSSGCSSNDFERSGCVVDNEGESEAEK